MKREIMKDVEFLAPKRAICLGGAERFYKGGTW